MPSTGRPTPTGADEVPDADESGELYELLVELDRLDELLEELDEAGVATRAEATAAGQATLASDMDELGVATRADAERRMAEVDAAIEASPVDSDG